MTKRALLRMLEREREAFAAERRLLIEQICHLSKPWTVSPSDMANIYERQDEDEEEPQFVHVDQWPE